MYKRITFAWDASETPDVEYRLRHSTTSDLYSDDISEYIDVGNVLQYSWIREYPTGTNYFVCTATQESDGVTYESAYSNEVSDELPSGEQLSLLYRVA